jgi:maleylpyruvate isomerase
VSTPLDATWLNRCVEGCAQSHQQLLALADSLTDAQCRAPSLLPGWTRGHLLTHLARNAERHVHLFDCASRGEVGDQYPGGMSQRNADIESGAHRSAQELVEDLRRHVWALEAQWAHATSETWLGSARRPGGNVVPISDLVFLRWREVAIHLVDLDLGVDHESWDDQYVQEEINRQLAALRTQDVQIQQRPVDVDPSSWLAWMIGRANLNGYGMGPGFQP